MNELIPGKLYKVLDTFESAILLPGESHYDLAHKFVKNYLFGSFTFKVLKDDVIMIIDYDLFAYDTKKFLVIKFLNEDGRVHWTYGSYSDLEKQLNSTLKILI